MIEKINVETIELLSSQVLVKVSPNHDFREIPGPNGTKVELYIGDFAKDFHATAQNVAITGTILKTCEALSFHGELKTHQKGKTIASEEYNALNRSSMPFDVDLDVAEGDKVLFSHLTGLNAEPEGRLLKDEKYGYVMLMRYDMLYAKEVNDEIVPLNGWVFFIRDQKPSEYQLPSGLWICEKVDKYGFLKGTVVAADKPVRDYLNPKHRDTDWDLPKGQRIIVQPKFGYRIAHDVHAGKLFGIECVKRNYLLAIFDECLTSQN